MRNPFPTVVIFVLFLSACGRAALPDLAPEPAAYPGFDTWRYPGEATMRAWRGSSPYRWVGYYLESPCHRGSTWTGRRAEIADMGWGIAMIYVGQQAFEGQPAPDPETPRDSIICSRTLLTDEQGRIDGADAIARAAAEGFAPGAVIFLDVERMTHATPEVVAYYRAWYEAVLNDGAFTPGTYAHRRNAAELYLLAGQLHQREGTGNPVFWVAGGDGFTLASRPQDSGLGFVRVWQGVLDVDRSWGGHTIRVDENVAATPSPSAGNR